MSNQCMSIDHHSISLADCSQNPASISSSRGSCAFSSQAQRLTHPKKNELTREIERHDFRRYRVVRRRQRLEEGGCQSFERRGVVEPTVQAQYLPRAASSAAARRRTVVVVVVVDVESRPVPRRELHPVGARVGPLRHSCAAADYDAHAPGGCCYRGRRNRSSEHNNM